MAIKTLSLLPPQACWSWKTMAPARFDCRPTLATRDTDTQSLSAVDYDHDGDLDSLYLHRFCQPDALRDERVEFVYHDANDGAANALFRNDIGADGKWQFTDVTQQVGSGCGQPAPQPGLRLGRLRQRWGPGSLCSQRLWPELSLPERRRPFQERCSRGQRGRLGLGNVGQLGRLQPRRLDGSVRGQHVFFSREPDYAASAIQAGQTTRNAKPLFSVRQGKHAAGKRRPRQISRSRASRRVSRWGAGPGAASLPT